MIGSRLHHLMRKLRKDMSGETGTSERAFARVGLSFSRARIIVKFFYLFSTYISYMALADLHRLAEQTPEWDFLWPVRWLTNLPIEPSIDWLALACFLSALLAFQFEGQRLFRILFAATFLCITALGNSQGGTNHQYHAWLWISIGLVFLPGGATRQPSRAVKMSYLTTIATCQGLLLSFYSLAGMWKTLTGIVTPASGHGGNLSPTGLISTLADRILQTGTSPLLAQFVIDHVWLAWPMFLVLIYAQLVAIFILFRPQLHIVWGYLLIGFHVGTWLLMEIVFPQHLLFLALFFILSPFRPERTSLGDILFSLPFFGSPLRHVLSRNPGSWITARLAMTGSVRNRASSDPAI